MLKKREALKGALHTRSARVQPTEGGAEDNAPLTFVMVSADNDGMRYDWMSGSEYIERLDINGANMERLNTFFKDHSRSVDAAIGRAVNKRKEGTELLADVEFDEDGAAIRRKYINGTLTDVSIGYEIKSYTVEERKDQPDIVTVTDYDIFELSAVGVGFDAGAKHKRGLGAIPDEKIREMSDRLGRVETKLKTGAKK